MADLNNAAYLPPPLIPTDIAADAELPNEAAKVNADIIAVVGADANASANADATASANANATASVNTEATASVNADATASVNADATATSPRDETPHFPTVDEIRQVLYDVVDPEINISIIDLGLVYDIIPIPEEGKVQINMTLTSPGCPLGPEITSAVYLKVSRLPLVKECQVELVWTPMWDPSVNPTEETRIALGIW